VELIAIFWFLRDQLTGTFSVRIITDIFDFDWIKIGGFGELGNFTQIWLYKFEQFGNNSRVISIEKDCVVSLVLILLVGLMTGRIVG
jgi:hypothetical protein